MRGPLAGVRIVEFAGIGPGPFACMMLADHGAEVIRIERPEELASGGLERLQKDVLARSRTFVSADLKSAEGIQLARDLIASADGLVESFRPGVMERLSLGPDEALQVNPKLVYGRMTGWGQTGPYAHAAGHDINYIALSGALHAIGRANEKPIPPVNLVGDFGGGAMMLAFGMVSALYHARATGEGQVVDCAITDGSALLTSMIWTFIAQGHWLDQRGVNVLDGGAHFYDTYETKDGKFIALGAIEPKFYALLRQKCGLNGEEWDAPYDASRWPTLKEKLAAIIKMRTRAEWCADMEHTDACFAPVLSLREAPLHPHNKERGVFVEVGGVVQPAPAPRYSRTETKPPEMWDGIVRNASVQKAER